MSIDRATIRKLALENGFTIKEGLHDLKEYVFDFGQALADVAVERSSKEPPPKDTIYIIGYDHEAKVICRTVRSSTKPSEDISRMQTALEFHYALKRGVDIPPQVAFDHILKSPAPSVGPDMVAVERDALLTLLRAALRINERPEDMQELHALHHSHEQVRDELKSPITILMKNAHVKA